jgi:hypothetical protein
VSGTLPALVGRAYTSVHQASVLLAQRVDVHQAVLQLATANADLAQWERASRPADDALVAARSRGARAVRSETDPRALAAIQGWFGRHGDSLLGRTVRRVFRATGPVPEDTRHRRDDDTHVATCAGVDTEVLLRAGGRLPSRCTGPRPWRIRTANPSGQSSNAAATNGH